MLAWGLLEWTFALLLVGLTGAVGLAFLSMVTIRAAVIRACAGSTKSLGYQLRPTILPPGRGEWNTPAR